MNSLPESLDKTYEQCLTREQQDERAWSYCRRLVFWTAYSPQPLTVPQMQEAIGIPEMQSSWDATKIIAANPIQYGANLVEEHANRRLVRFVHSSVKQYLESRETRFLFRYATDEDLYRTSGPQSFAELGLEFCADNMLKYLSFEDFKAQITIRSEAAMQVPTSNLLRSVKQSVTTSPVLNTIMDLRFRPSRPSAENVVFSVPYSRGSEETGLTSRYKCLRTFRSTWPLLTESIYENLNATSSRQLQNLVEVMNGVYRLQPWVRRGMTYRQYATAAIRYSVQHDTPHILRFFRRTMKANQLMDILLSRGTDSDQSLVQLAAYLGHQRILRYIRHDEGLNQKKIGADVDSLGQNLLHYAAMSGIDTGCLPIESKMIPALAMKKNSYGDTAIDVAYQYDNLHWIKALLKFLSTDRQKLSQVCSERTTVGFSKKMIVNDRESVEENTRIIQQLFGLLADLTIFHIKDDDFRFQSVLEESVKNDDVAFFRGYGFVIRPGYFNDPVSLIEWACQDLKNAKPCRVEIMDILVSRSAADRPIWHGKVRESHTLDAAMAQVPDAPIAAEIVHLLVESFHRGSQIFAKDTRLAEETELRVIGMLKPETVILMLDSGLWHLRRTDATGDRRNLMHLAVELSTTDLLVALCDWVTGDQLIGDAAYALKWPKEDALTPLLLAISLENEECALILVRTGVYCIDRYHFKDDLTMQLMLVLPLLESRGWREASTHIEELEGFIRRQAEAEAFLWADVARQIECIKRKQNEDPETWICEGREELGKWYWARWRDYDVARFYAPNCSDQSESE
jgi:hypothetical protein